MVTNLAQALRLLLVTDDRLLAGRDVVSVCRAAVGGGVTAVQLRLKHVEPRELVTLARALRSALPVPIIINDRLDVALAAAADGVHLGPEDLPVALARRIVPPGFVIGASVGTAEEADRGRGADYWGVGPLRATRTKPGAGAALDLAGFRQILALAPEGMPCVAIGGVRPEDVRGVREAGGAGVAVVSGILSAERPAIAAAAYLR
jgi:thiamine-phosphate pyrophosphorylase